MQESSTIPVIKQYDTMNPFKYGDFRDYASEMTINTGGS